MLNAIDISTSALVAQRVRMDTISGNIANMNSTRDEQGNVSPFQRRLVKFQAADSLGNSRSKAVGVKYSVEIDSKQPRIVHEPNHPDANEEGNVAYPNISLMTEFTNAITASRAYQANVAVIDITKEMANTSLRILS